MISKHLDKEKLHHAYLIEGEEEKVIDEVLKFVESLGVGVVGNPDFCHITLDSFKIEDARNLKSLGGNKAFSSGKKVFIISANNFLSEAQNTMLKIFEEPIENTHFFLITRDINALLPTFVSRFYVIPSKSNPSEDLKDAERFIKMPLVKRIDFIKNLLAEEKEDELEINLNSTRQKALNFINALEISLHNKFQKNFSGFLQPSAGTFPGQNSLKICLEQIFKVRKFLRMPGTSAKNLLESLALSVPNL
ncbi:hypothetical protein HZA26_00320 [Candidatus Nomurabacteria bacterium]|nr:hypothetical protein [Candidatus Nomurabacteria bacterium]